MRESIAFSTSDDADNDLTTVATRVRTAIAITGTVTERIVRPAWKVERAKIREFFIFLLKSLGLGTITELMSLC